MAQMPVALSAPAQRDLGHVAVVHRYQRLEDLAVARDELLAAGIADVRMRSAVEAAEIGREQLAPRVPLLGVHEAEVARLEALDRLDVLAVQARHRIRSVGVRRSPVASDEFRRQT
jgi:hypothetical protein